MERNAYLEAMDTAKRLDEDERAARLSKLLGLDADGRRVLAEAFESAGEAWLDDMRSGC